MTRIGLAAALSLVLASSICSASGSDRAEARQPDPALMASVKAIRDAFRAGRTEPILPLLPATGKVYLAVKAIAPDSSYYSRDQVVALLRQAFASLVTIEFHINFDRPGDSAGGAQVTVCPAAWTLNNRGARTDLRLRFLLSHQDDQWTLSEIRETR